MIPWAEIYEGVSASWDALFSSQECVLNCFGNSRISALVLARAPADSDLRQGAVGPEDQLGMAFQRFCGCPARSAIRLWAQVAGFLHRY